MKGISLMCEKGKVSVIITTFGKPEKLERAINSVINQTYKNIELIVVDDNNPDTENRIAVENIMRKYIGNQQIDIEIKYFRHTKNMNGSAARNTGIKQSTGEYIAFLDDDDIYLPERVEFSIKKMIENKEIIGVCVGVIHIKNSHIIGVTQKVNNSILTPKMILLDQMVIGTGSNIFLKSNVVFDVNGFDAEFDRFQDLEFIIRVSQLGKIIYTDKLLIIKDDTKTRVPKYNKLKRALELFEEKFAKEIKELDEAETEKFLADRLTGIHFCLLSDSTYYEIVNSSNEIKKIRTNSLKSMIVFLPAPIQKMVYNIYISRLKIIREKIKDGKYRKIFGEKQYNYIKSLL